MKRVLLIILLVLPLTLVAQTLTAYRNQVSNGYNFWVCTPKNYDSLKSDVPVILFLHGASLCGNNLDRVRRYGPLDALKMGRQIEALIIAPQNPGGAWNPQRVNNVVNWVFDHYAGDTNRFYVYGMSAATAPSTTPLPTPTASLRLWLSVVEAIPNRIVDLTNCRYG